MGMNFRMGLYESNVFFWVSLAVIAIPSDMHHPRRLECLTS